MRKKRIKVLFFSVGSKLTAEELTSVRQYKLQLHNMFDEDKTDIHVLMRNSAVPQHIEPCDYVCGNVPLLFSNVKVLTIQDAVTDKRVAKPVKKKEITENVY